LRTISYRLRNRPNMEICTVDKYQGRDKACILVSLVRSNAKQNVSDYRVHKFTYPNHLLLPDW
jgi:DNA replication ATP-dependent helicase Dna2